MGFRKKKTFIEQAREQAVDLADNVRPQVEAALATAKEKSAPVIAEAREKAAPVIADAREKAAPVIAEGKARLTEGKDFAAAKAVANLQRAEERVAALQSDPPKKKGKLRKLVLFSLIAGAAGFAVKKLTSQPEQDNWQSSYTPPPPPAAAPTPAPEPDEEAGGAAPDEALADAAEQPHPVTTPDEPAEVVEIDDDKSK